VTRLRRGHRSPGPDTGREPGTSPEPDSGAWWTDPGAEGSGGAGADAGRADRPEAVQASLPPLPPSSRERRPREPWIPEPPPFRTLSGPDIAGIVLLGALGIGVLVVLGLFVLNRFDERDPVAAATPAASSAPAPTRAPASAPAVATPVPTSAPAASTPATPTRSPEVVVPGPLAGAAYSGPLRPLEPVSAGAACTAGPTDDGKGGEVRHDAELVLDDDPETAWMCRGLAVGKRLTIRFDAPTTVAEIGIVNGWAKGRAGSRSDLYRQYRRIEAVRYRFDGDRWIDHELDPTDRSTQTLRIPATTTRTVTVELREISSASRDATAVSGLTFAGPPAG